MKENYRITKTTDSQADTCWKISYEQYGTLYTMPEAWYTKKAAQEKLKQIERETINNEKM